MKRPSFQFYPADWRKDAALQSCSMAAQGLWINIMCIAHECENYGHLTINGRPMLPAQIARLVGLSAKECDSLLKELHDCGVLSIASCGSVFSRRMVRDEEIRNKRAAGGEAGSSHGSKGAEHGKKGGRPPKGRGVIEPPLEPPPSSSSSSSSSKPSFVESDGVTDRPSQSEPSEKTTHSLTPVDVFAMDRDWNPSIEFEKNLPPSLITDIPTTLRDLQEFRLYRIGTGQKHTQAQWENLWLKNMESNKKHREATLA
jgi:hypothetical protein